MKEKRVRLVGGVPGTIVLGSLLVPLILMTACRGGSNQTHSAVAQTKAAAVNDFNNSPRMAAGAVAPAPEGSETASASSVGDSQKGSTQHLYTSSSSGLEPTSSNTASRIYSESSNTNGVNPVKGPVPTKKNGLGSNMAPQDVGVSEADRALATKIRVAVGHDPSFSQIGPEVKIVVDNGKVSLQGAIDNQKERKSLLELVRSTEGVKSVDDQLEVKPTVQ